LQIDAYWSAIVQCGLVTKYHTSDGSTKVEVESVN